LIEVNAAGKTSVHLKILDRSGVLEATKMIDGLIYDVNDGKPIAWIENSSEVYSTATRRRFAMLRGGTFFSIDGIPLGLSLNDLNAQMVGERNALAQLKALAKRVVSMAAA
jgi:hypothetical protein